MCKIRLFIFFSPWSPFVETSWIFLTGCRYGCLLWRNKKLMPHLANWYFQIKRFISVEKLETDQFIFSSISSHAFVQISIHLNNRLQFRQNFWDENFWRISRKKQSQVWVGNEHESEWTKTQRVIEYKHIFIDGNSAFVLMLIVRTLLLRKYMKFPKNSANHPQCS